MTILLIFPDAGPGGAPPPVINIDEAIIAIVDLGNYVDDVDVGNYISITDTGNYVDITDTGIYAVQVKGGLIIMPVGILRWGLAQFGTTGILGYGPIITTNVQNWNVMRI